MAIKPISPDEFAENVQRVMDAFEDGVFDVLSKTSRVVAREAKVKLQETSPRSVNGGEYAASWATTYDKKLSKEQMSDVFKVYNKKHYRLTHLLEHGYIHYKTGKRTGQRVHIKPVDDWVKKEYPNQVVGGLQEQGVIE